jgi:hypothetical protein
MLWGLAEYSQALSHSFTDYLEKRKQRKMDMESVSVFLTQ